MAGRSIVGNPDSVPDVDHTVPFDAQCLADALETHQAVYVSDGGKTVAVAFSPAAFRAMVERVEFLEIQLSAWEADLEYREERLVDHEEVVASTERIVSGEG